MLSLSLGIAAALGWAIHDLLVRRFSQDLPPLPMMLAVLAVGTVVLAVPALAFGDLGRVTAAGLGFAGLAGLAYVAALAGLYFALSMAPVRLVAPVVGAYPMLSLVLAAADGRPVAWIEWLAVAAIVAGIATVSLTGSAGSATTHPGRALGLSVLSAIGFAATFWLAQEAGRRGAELPAMAVTRAVAFVVVALAALLLRTPVRAVAGRVRVLAAMGVLDALALAAVSLAAGLAFPEYASISSSLFGVLTILLAWRFLGERVSPRQGIGIALVFAGIAALSASG